MRVAAGIGAAGEKQVAEIAELIKQRNPYIFTSETIELPNNQTLTVPKDNEKIIELFKKVRDEK